MEVFKPSPTDQTEIVDAYYAQYPDGEKARELINRTMERMGSSDDFKVGLTDIGLVLVYKKGKTPNEWIFCVQLGTNPLTVRVNPVNNF